MDTIEPTHCAPLLVLHPSAVEKQAKGVAFVDAILHIEGEVQELRRASFTIIILSVNQASTRICHIHKVVTFQ